jgi:hypothetical protein
MGKHNLNEGDDLQKPVVRRAVKQPKNRPCTSNATCKATKHKPHCPKHSSH